MHGLRAILLLSALVWTFGSACSSDSGNGTDAHGGSGGEGAGGSDGGSGGSGGTGGHGGAGGSGGGDVESSWIDLDGKRLRVPIEDMIQVEVAIDRELTGEGDIHVSIDGALPTGIALASSIMGDPLEGLIFASGYDSATFYISAYGVDALTSTELQIEGSGEGFEATATFWIQALPIVTKASDGGAGSLRDVIAKAMTLDAYPFVSFSPEAFSAPTTITLGSPIELSSDVEIMGPVLEGKPLVTVEAAGGIVFHNRIGSRLILDSLRLEGGSSPTGSCVLAEGSLVVRRMHFHGCSSTSGGAISSRRNLEVRNSTFTENTASQSGGAIHAEGVLEISASTFRGNEAERGGAVWADKPVVRESTFDGNEATDSGGGLVAWYEGTIAQSTFTNNRAPSGGAILLQEETKLSVQFSTIVGNQASVEGGGIWAGGGLDLSLKGSIIADNLGGPRPNLSVPHAMLSSDGYNLIGDTTGADIDPSDYQDTDQVGIHGPIAPVLAGLEDNGGPTLTMRPLPDSPVIDAVPVSDCTVDGEPLENDQRGSPRPAGSACDIGAVEAD